MKHCYALATPDLPLKAHVFGLNGDFSENLRQIKDCGYDGADFVTCNPGKLEQHLLAKQVEQLDFIVPMICTGEIVKQEGLELASPDPAVREATVQRFYALIDFASLVGAGVNIGRSRGCIHEGYSREQTDVFALESFEKITAYAEQHHVLLALEPVTRKMINYLNTLDEVLTLTGKIGSPNFGYMLGSQHMVLDEPDLEKTILQSAKNALHIHLVDDNRGPVGTGKIGFDQLIGLIHASGYQGTFSHECSAPGFELRAMRESMKYMQPILSRYYR